MRRVPAVRGVVTVMVLAAGLLTVPAAIPASAHADTVSLSMLQSAL
jgi:hypothetical protein